MMTLNLLMNKIKEIVRKHYRLVLTIMFSLIVIILYGSISNHGNIWYDEAYQLILNENSLLNIIKYVARDFHVPFYAIGLKIVTTIFGSSPFVGRMFSLGAIIGCFILSFSKIKDLFSLKTSILFSCFLLSLSCIYFCSIEIRPYSWPMFLTLASSVYMLSIIKNKDNKSFVLYTIFSILAIYSHNIAMIYIVISEIVFLIYLLIKNRGLIKKYLLSLLIKLICYLPWLNVLKNQYSNLESSFWIKSPELKSFLNDCMDLFSRIDYVVYILLLMLLISFIYIKINKIKKNYLLLIYFLTTIIICYLISVYKTPLLISKYITTFIGVFILFISDILSNIKSKIFLAILFGILVYNSYDNYKYEYKKIDEVKIKEEINYFNNSLDKLYFIHYSEFSLGEFRYYFPNAIHFYTDEIDSNLRDYELFGDNVIKLNDISELDDMEIDTLWISNLDFVVKANNSREYFKSWKVLEYFEYTNYYYYGKNYLKMISKIDLE